MDCRYSLRRRCIFSIIALSICFATTASSFELASVGVRYGQGFRGTDFDQYDISATMDLPWQKECPYNWLLHSDIEGILSVLTWDGDTAVKPSVMPNLILSTPGGMVDFIAGLGLGVMFGDTEFDGDHDLGGAFFFQGQAGFRVNVTDNVFVGYRYYHQSNAGIYNSNDSVNLNQVEIGWKF